MKNIRFKIMIINRLITKLSVFVVLSSVFFTSQVNAQVGINTTVPEGILDISSNNQGVVFPRVSLTDKLMQAPVTNPNGANLVIGTVVYNINTSGAYPNNVIPGYYFWDGTSWIEMNSDNIYKNDGIINEERTVGVTNTVNFDNSTFLIDGINNRVGVGVTSPLGKFHVDSNDGADVVFSMGSNTANENMDIDIYRYRGTNASPTTIQDGDGLGGIRFNGLNSASSGIVAPFSTMAEINAEADGTVSSTSAPGILYFKTTTEGSISPSTKLTITNKGEVGVATTTPNTSLEVASKPSDITFYDGVLHPKLTGDQLQTKTYTANQDGAIVYVTSAATSLTGQVEFVYIEGLYIFNADTNKWVLIKSNTNELAIAEKLSKHVVVTNIDGNIETDANSVLNIDGIISMSFRKVNTTFYSPLIRNISGGDLTITYQTFVTTTIQNESLLNNTLAHNSTLEVDIDNLVYWNTSLEVLTCNIHIADKWYELQWFSHQNASNSSHRDVFMTVTRKF